MYVSNASVYDGATVASLKTALVEAFSQVYGLKAEKMDVRQADPEEADLFRLLLRQLL